MSIMVMGKEKEKGRLTQEIGKDVEGAAVL